MREDKTEDLWAAGSYKNDGELKLRSLGLIVAGPFLLVFVEI